MLITVAALRERVATALPKLVEDLQNATGRFGDEEAKAWAESLPRFSKLLSDPPLQGMHLYCSVQGELSLEYQLPASGSFADVVLLGANDDKPSAVIIELKHWLTRGDRPGRAEGLVERQGVQELHPSEQVRGYVEYCSRFHSAVQSAGATVQGCVLFTRDFVTQAYVAAPNEALAKMYPVFTLSEEDVRSRIPSSLSKWLTRPDSEFAHKFEKGTYRQERGFVRQIAAQIQDTKLRPFELLDNQRRAFALCCVEADEAIGRWTKGESPRKVVVVKGPPGSGKSAVAARLWAHLSQKEELPEGDLAFVTTSMSQNTNWGYLFEAASARGARGLIRKATAFHPITTQRVGRLREQHGRAFLEGVDKWRYNLELLSKMGEEVRDGARDQQFLVSIVDEAHSLINTESGGGVGQFGFAPTLGPQAYHVIRSSSLVVFLMDPAQGFRHRENTSIDDIRDWAGELGAGEIVEIDLSGVQFRCAGSMEYVGWLESFLDGSNVERNQVMASAWYLGSETRSNIAQASAPQVVPIRRAAQPESEYVVKGNVVSMGQRSRRTSFDFRVFKDPFTLEQELRELVSAGFSARILSSYSREWITTDAAQPHVLPPSMQDFCEEVKIGGETKVWSRVWNVVLNGVDYSPFVQGLPASRLFQDPLAEVGCPYAVRGFDFDYVGVLWLEDLVWRDGAWSLNLDYMHESGLIGLRRQARRDEKARDLLSEKVRQAYRILLTRAMRGAFVWVKDPETRSHLENSLAR